MLNRWLPTLPTPLISPVLSPWPREEHAVEAPVEVIDQRVLEKIRILERKGAPNLVARLIGLYLRDAPQLINQMKQASVEEDYETLLTAAHTLKSSSANVGAWLLQGLCKELEMQARRQQVIDAPEQVADIEQTFIAAQALLRRELPESTG